MQAAIIAGHSSSQLGGFSHITNEIGKLVSETSEAGRQMNQVAKNLMTKISELKKLTETGKQTAKSLVENNQRSEKILDELEVLIQQLSLEKTTANLSSTVHPVNGKMTRLSQESPNSNKNLANRTNKKLEKKDTNVSEFSKLNNNKEKEKLLQQIQSILNSRNIKTNTD